MNLHYLTYLLVISLFCISANIHAGSDRNCRILFPERPRGAPKTAFLFSGKKSQSVSLPNMNFSKVIPLPEGELTLILSTEEIRNPENLPAGSISLQVPSETKDFYVLLSSDISNISFPVRMELIPIGEGHLEPGETLWINYTNYIIQAVLGNDSLPEEFRSCFPGRHMTAEGAASEVAQ